MTKRTSRQNSVDAKKGSQGFTLLEVLIAIVILSVGLLGMGALVVGIINANRLSKDMTTATTLAQDKMEDIQRVGYANTAAETMATMPSPFSDYKREVKVTDLTVTDLSPPTDMKTVRVKICWGGASKEDHKVELETILAK